MLGAGYDSGVGGLCGTTDLVGDWSNDSHHHGELVGRLPVRLVLIWVDFRLPFAHTRPEVLARISPQDGNANGNYQAPETGVRLHLRLRDEQRILAIIRRNRRWTGPE